MIEVQTVQNLLGNWWFDYDQGSFETWPRYFAEDVHFCCRSDSGDTPFEDFIRADVRGRSELVAWQTDHRRKSPYPLRHNVTDIHLISAGPTEASFRSYLFVTHIAGGKVSNASSGICLGKVRREDDEVKIAELQVILDFTDSVVFDEAHRNQLA